MVSVVLRAEASHPCRPSAQAMTRRIDALYCTRDDAEQRVTALIDHIQKSAQRASQEAPHLPPRRHCLLSPCRLAPRLHPATTTVGRDRHVT